MTLQEFSLWLAETPISNALRENAQAVPTLQSIHLVAICVVVSSALMLDLRVLGVGKDTSSIGFHVRRYMPWLGWSLLVLLLTGALLVVGEPDRTLLNWVFWTKMGLVAAGAVISALFAFPVKRDELYWDAPARAPLAMGLAVISLAVWVTVVISGRWIAYVL